MSNPTNILLLLLSWERHAAASRKILLYFFISLMREPVLAAVTTVSDSVMDCINIPQSKCSYSHQTQDSHSRIELDYVDFFCCSRIMLPCIAGECLAVIKSGYMIPSGGGGQHCKYAPTCRDKHTHPSSPQHNVSYG